MDPENNEGNIEYKLKLKNNSEQRINELATQMRYRCNESPSSECFYIIGVEDDGTEVGITEEEYVDAIKILNVIADKNNYYVQILKKTPISKERNIYEVLVRENTNNKYIDIKVAIAGNVDSSKSSTLGCLVTGQLDNGRGLSRMSVFNYSHELKTGRTSSISHQILGYDYKGQIVNYQGVNKLSWNDIVQRSTKIISFFDLAGHEKYLKTTILGISSSIPNICMIMIGANNGISKMTVEHIFICITFKIPFIFVISKIDLCKDRANVLEETNDQINKLLKHPSVRRIGVRIKDNEDIILSCKNIYSNSITPIFQISNVTGEGLDKLRMFFNIIGEKPKNDENQEVEYFVDNIFHVKGVGIVIGGHLLSGTIRVGDNLLLGPNSTDGTYESVTIKSIHSKKVNVQIVSSGSYVCLSFKKIDRKLIRKGIVLISSKSEKLAVKTFIAKVDVMKSHSTTIKKGYEPLFCLNSIRQTVRILEIKDKKNSRNVVNDDNVLRTNDNAMIKLHFKYRPEYIKVNSRFIMCENHLKIVGEIIEIL